MNPICTTCAMVLGVDSRFCHGCGAMVSAPSETATRFASPLSYTPQHLAERILTARGALEGEHKRVTVMFCDIANSTSLAERIGEERMYELLNRFFELALEEVHRYRGTVNQFLGDGFMALFGAPLALEHHEQHAVLAALALRAGLAQRFQDVQRSTGMAFEVRVGVNTGLVVVGKIGDNLRMDYTAVGDSTHVAARLQAMAAPGEILISHATFDATRAVVDTHGLGPVPIKGKREPVEIYRVLGARSPAASTQVMRQRHLSRFVGREREIGLLMDALDDAEAGRGRAIFLVSEPGMGKSRLLWEFHRQLAERVVTYLEGQCLSYGATTPYLPILDILRTTCRLVDGDSGEQVAAKLHATALSVGMDADAAAPYLLHLLAMQEPVPALAGLAPETVQLRTIETLRQLSLRSSRRRPLVLVIEDLHWMDRSSEGFINVLADSLAGAPILLVVTSRPGYSPAWINKSYASQIALRPLPVSGGLAIVHEVLVGQAMADAVARDIVTRAEGNPLFLEELARAIGERATTAAVPDTLLGVLAARIDLLPETSKRVLQTASVIGREFPAHLLAMVWHDSDTLDDDLLRLTRLEFVHERAGDNEPVYVFKHALTRDAAYASLLSGRRRACHRAVGRALEQLHADRPDDAAELLAHHFGESDHDDDAVRYTIRAFERALRRWANTEAMAFSESALRRLEQMPQTDATRLLQIDLVVQQAESRFALGQHAAQLSALTRVGQLLEAADDAARRAAWHYWMGFLNSITGGSTEASITHCKQALAIAQEAELEDLGARAACCLAQVYMIAGELRQALESGERALAVFERRGDRWWACRTLAQLSPAANAVGEWQRSLDYCQRALDHGIAMDDLRLKVSGYIRLASTQIQRGDWQAGLAYCEQAQALSPVEYDAAALRAIRGYGLVKAGRAEEGTAEIAGALEWYGKSNLRYTQAFFSLWLAEGYLRCGTNNAARKSLEQVIANCDELAYCHLRGVALRLLAECHLPADKVSATRCLREAIDVLQQVGALEQSAVARRQVSALSAAVAGSSSHLASLE